MAAGISGEGGDWEALLWSLMAVDNAERNRAEQQFAELKQQSDVTLLGLIHVVHSRRSDDVRGLAAVLLRRVLLRDAVSLWPNASADVRAAVKRELLAVLLEEQNRSIRRKVCDTVGELASSILEDGQWDDLLPTLLEWVEDAHNVALRENTLRVLEMIAIFLANQIAQEAADAKAASLQVAKDGTSLEVTVIGTLVRRIADAEGHVAVNAIRALSMLLLNMDSLDAVAHPELLGSTVSLVLQALHRMLANAQFEEVMETLEVLIELVEPHPLYFKPGLKHYVETMVRIADAPAATVVVGGSAMPDGCRQLAMEFLVSIAEQAPSKCKRLSKNFFVHAVYPIAFKMMLELLDVDTWNVTNCEDEQESVVDHEISNFDVGSEALERLVAAIGPKRSLPKCFALIQEYASNTENWLFRHAALVGLCQILEVLTYEHLDAIVQHLLAQAYDPHPRVCCTAIDVIGQMSVDQGPQFQEAYHAQALTVLAHYLEDFSKPRLQAHAATALRQFIDMCQPETLEPYLEKLLAQLFAILQPSAPGQSRVVQEQSITAISSIATVGGASFGKYYGAVIPSLKQILLSCLQECTTTGAPGSFTLGGITLECISLIGVAVGKDVFGPDAVEIMTIMAEMQNTPKIVGNEWIRTYLLQAWARCCKCLGKDFAPYLPVVMPTLLFAAMQQAEFEVDPTTLPSDDDDDASTDGEDIQIAQVNDRCLSIRTSILEEKATACQLLAGMVMDLEDAFFPYAEQVTQVLAPLMTDSVHSDIRSSAISSMPALVKCVALASSNSEAIKQMIDFTLGRLVNALTSEPEVELVMIIMQSMKMCIVNGLELHPHVSLNEAQLKELVLGLLLVLGDSFQRRAVRRAEKSAELAESEGGDSQDAASEHAVEEEIDDDDDDDDENQDVEQELQFVLADCIGSLAKTHGDKFFPVFQLLLWDKIAELAAAHCLAEDRKLALYILDDVLEYCGVRAMNEVDVFLPLLSNVLQTSDNYPPLIQASAFGIGVCARLGGDRFAKHAHQCLQLLRGVMTNPHAREPAMLNATDNVVSAFGLICEYQAGAIDAAALFPQYLLLLPLRGDLEESVEVMNRLCMGVDERKELVLGANGANLQRIVAIFADVIASRRSFVKNVGEEVYTALRDRVAASLVGLRASIPEPMMTQAWATLSGQQQAALHSLFG
jgi:hypothetical protein